MSEMIARVARAIFDVNFAHYTAEKRDATYPKVRRITLEIARAAIEAMREPTEAMQSAGGEQEDRNIMGSSSSDARATYRAMIDAALTTT